MAALPGLLEYVESVLKVVALAGGGLFFGWKLFTGWLIINLTLSIELERAPASGADDHLGITVRFEKGTTDSIWLQDVKVWTGTAASPDLKMHDFSDELHRFDTGGGRLPQNRVRKGVEKVALSPGESMTIARYVTVPAGEPVSVEAAAFGKRAFWPRGFQWRASAVSLPLPPADGSSGAASSSAS